MRALITLLALGLGACDMGPADNDGDGYDIEADCNDSNPDVHPGATEVCNEVDDDCSGLVDDDPVDIGTWYLDWDGDGYGDDATEVDACERPSGHTDRGGDCDDERARVNPEGVEECDADDLDEDCDGAADDADDDVTGLVTWYKDADLDGWGATGGASTEACDPGEGWSEVDTDCDDGDAEVYPGAVDLVCDGRDSDCDGEAEGIATLGALEFFDLQAAVDAASPGETVTVCPGAHDAALVISEAITLEGHGGDPEAVVLDGSSAGEAPVISVDAESFTLTGIGIHNGTAGGLDAEVGQLSLADCRFESNVASTGGAVAVTFRDENYAVSVERCHFEGNTTDRSNAGAMFIGARGGDTDIVIADSVFQANEANKAGGALWIDVTATVDLEISDTTFSTNIASSRGGGLFLELDSSGVLTADLDTVVFEDNAADQGAGLAVLSAGKISELVLDSCTWTGNIATGSGGGALVDTTGQTVVEAQDCTFSANEAGSRGGAVLFDIDQHGRLELTDTSIVDNTAALGGGLNVGGSATNITVTLDTCSLDGNEATSTGGGLWLNGARVTMSGGEVLNSTGGGAYLEGTRVGLACTSADWGTPEVDDNDPWDVSVEGQGEWSSFESGASFECDRDGCSPA